MNGFFGRKEKWAFLSYIYRHGVALMEKGKYVNATELIKLAKKEMSAGFAYPEGKPTGDEDIYRQKWAFIVQVLEAANAVDVEEVTRCDQCIWYEACQNNNCMKIMEKDDYCSYGEKKNG